MAAMAAASLAKMVLSEDSDSDSRSISDSDSDYCSRPGSTTSGSTDHKTTLIVTFPTSVKLKSFKCFTQEGNWNCPEKLDGRNGEKVVFARDTSHHGSYALATWKIEGTDKQLAIMCCNPYSKELYYNWIVLALLDNKDVQDVEGLYKTMYTKYDTENYKWGDFSNYEDAMPEKMIHEDDVYSVEATMTGKWKCTVTVHVDLK
jgi:hypothetical protein